VKPGRALARARRRCSITRDPPRHGDRVTAAARSKSEHRPGAILEQANTTMGSATPSRTTTVASRCPLVARGAL
jgi:hypothetical protein